MSEFDLRYQSIYINEKANWDSKIVLIKEVFPDPSTNTTILKSLRLENVPAFVVCGTINQLRYFRKAVSLCDEKCEMGKLKTATIIKVLGKIIAKCSLKVVYKQNAPQITTANIFQDFKKEWAKQTGEQKTRRLNLLKFLKTNWPRIKDLEKAMETHPNAAYVLENLTDELDLSGDGLDTLVSLMGDPEWVDIMGIKKQWEDESSGPNMREILLKITNKVPKESLKTEGNVVSVLLNKGDENITTIKELLDESGVDYDETESGKEVTISFSRNEKRRGKLKSFKILGEPKLVIKNIKKVWKRLGLEKQGFGLKPEKAAQEVATFLKMMNFNSKLAEVKVEGYKVDISVKKEDFEKLQDLIKEADIQKDEIAEPILRT